MEVLDDISELAVHRRVFPSWSIDIPASFDEAFVSEGEYWHAYDDHRSVSLTSFELTEKGRPVPAMSIVRQFPPMPGSPVAELPPGLLGWAVIAEAIQPARAMMALSGMLVTDGHVVLATITSDDTAWARRIWLSVRSHPPRGN